MINSRNLIYTNILDLTNTRTVRTHRVQLVLF